jgi:hypothetical protein
MIPNMYSYSLEKKQEPPQKRVPKKSVSQTQRNNQDFVGEKRRSVMLTPEQMREFNAGGASSSRYE